MEINLKTLLLALALSAVASPAPARSLQVTGETGYLSEWTFGGDVRESISGRVREIFGLLTMKHVGLCSQSGPEEKAAEISLQIVKPGLASHFQGTMTIDGSRCTFSGTFSDPYNGFMDCPNAKGVPVTLSIK
jgi:hypothetical protein